LPQANSGVRRPGKRYSGYNGINKSRLARGNGAAMSEFLAVARWDELGEGELLGVEVDGEPICLAKIDGVVYACNGECTHVGGRLYEGELQGSVLTCPVHGAQFDLRTGKVLRGPARQDLVLYPVRVEDGLIKVALPPD
jgi:nitrite reductase/ring-hydroxylating ferredoxin subunit